MFRDVKWKATQQSVDHQFHDSALPVDNDGQMPITCLDSRSTSAKISGDPVFVPEKPRLADTNIVQLKHIQLREELIGNLISSTHFLAPMPSFHDVPIFDHDFGLQVAQSRPADNHFPNTHLDSEFASADMSSAMVPMMTLGGMQPNQAQARSVQELHVSASLPADAQIPPTTLSSQPQHAKTANGDVTTLMLRHVPRKCTQRLFVRELDAAGFAGLYDFVYVPVSTWTLKNKGFAFVNFDSPETGRHFYRTFHNGKLRQFRSMTPLFVQPAVLQGFEANAEKHLLASSSSHLNVPLFLRPLPPHLVRGGSPMCSTTPCIANPSRPPELAGREHVAAAGEATPGAAHSAFPAGAPSKSPADSWSQEFSPPLHSLRNGCGEELKDEASLLR